ncbi:MAG: formylglycine-generating enzyme family protein [Bacillota bacterium]
MFFKLCRQAFNILLITVFFIIGSMFFVSQIVFTEEVPIEPELVFVPRGESGDYLELEDLHQDYDFYLSKFMVTNQDYLKFLNEADINSEASLHGKTLIDIENSFSHIGYDGNNFRLKQEIAEDNNLENLGSHPVTYVSWYGAAAYCNWLSEKEGLEPAYNLSTWELRGNPADLKGYRLPTVTEWQYAARGGDEAEETNFAGSDEVEEVGWYWGNSDQTTHPVGQKSPNELGMYDLTGNAWEWTNTYEGEYYATRGGGWSSSEFMAGFNFNGDCKVHQTYGDLGFRMARTALQE